MNENAEVKKFAVVGSESQRDIAAKLAEEIKASVYQRAGQIPLALAIGVLVIVQKELLDEA